MAKLQEIEPQLPIKSQEHARTLKINRWYLNPGIFFGCSRKQGLHLLVDGVERKIMDFGFANGDIVGIRVDRCKGEVQFDLNGEYTGVGYLMSDDMKKKRLFFTCHLGIAGDSAEIVVEEPNQAIFPSLTESATTNDQKSLLNLLQLESSTSDILTSASQLIKLSQAHDFISKRLDLSK